MASPEVSISVELGTIAQWVGAFATILAVLVALFKEEIVRWWRRPELEASITRAPPDCVQTKAEYSVQRTAHPFAAADSYWLRIWVKNTGKMRAEKVQVFAAALSKRVADGAFKPVDNFLPMNLRWSHAQDQAHAPEIFADGISPGMGKHCDLGHIIDPQHRVEVGEDLSNVPSGKTILGLELEVKPNTLSHLIPPGTYRLTLRIAAGNSKPVTKVVEISVTGDWYSDEKRMLSEGIGVRFIDVRL